MFEAALHSMRPRRRGSVLLSTGLHAALCCALVFPPMLRMPELAAEPPDNLPKFVNFFPKPLVEEPVRRLPQAPPTTTDARSRQGGGGPPPEVRVVTTPTEIGDLPEPLPDGVFDNTPERVGAFPYEPKKTGDRGDGTQTDDPPGGGGAVNANAPGVTPPVPLSTPAPLYPEVMRIANIQGVVILEAIIGRDGLVRDVRVMRGVNALLDRSASTAVLSWRYRPALVDDHPVSVYLTVTINFRITR
jgi:TonB family protein